MFKCVICGGTQVHLDDCPFARELRTAENRGRLRGLQEASQLYGRNMGEMVLVHRVDLQLLADLECKETPACSEERTRGYCLVCRVARWAAQTLRENDDLRHP